MIHLFGIEFETSGATPSRISNRFSRNGLTAAEFTVDCSAGVDAETVMMPLAPCEYTWDYIRECCAALNAAGADGGRGCGMHVHFSNAALLQMDPEQFSRESIRHTADTGRLITQDRGSEFLGDPMTAGELKDIMCRYTAQQSVINSMHPRSRTNNRMTQQLRLADIERAGPTVRELREATHGKFGTINLQPWTTFGTIEFRQAAGTIDAEKAINWVKFVHNLITWTRTERFEESTATTHTTPRTGASAFAAQARRIRMVYDMLRTANGASTQEIMLATGVAETSVRRMVSEIRNRVGDAAVVTHTQQAQGASYGDGTDLTRYQVLETWTDGTPTPTLRDNVNSSVWSGITDDDFDWWQDRIDALSGRTPPS